MFPQIARQDAEPQIEAQPPQPTTAQSPSVGHKRQRSESESESECESQSDREPGIPWNRARRSPHSSRLASSKKETLRVTRLGKLRFKLFNVRYRKFD